MEGKKLGVIASLGFATIITALSMNSVHAQPYAYVSDFNGVISVIDTNTNTQIQSINQPGGPMEPHPNGNLLYITGQDQNVYAYDTATHNLQHTIPINFLPRGINISPYSLNMYLADTGTSDVGRIKVLNTTDYSELATIDVAGAPKSVVFSADGNTAYVSHGSRAITVIDTITHTVVENLLLGDNGMVYPSVRDIIAHPSKNIMYVIGNGGYVHVYNTDTNTEITKIAIGGYVGQHLDITPDGSRLYIATSGSNVVVIDSDNNALLSTIPTNMTTFGVEAHPSGESVYVSGYIFTPTGPQSAVTVFDVASNSVITDLTVTGFLPVDIEIPPLQEDVAGTVFGVWQTTVTCRNLTTSQQVVVVTGSIKSWNCEAEGLLVNSGDQIEMNVISTAK